MERERRIVIVAPHFAVVLPYYVAQIEEADRIEKSRSDLTIMQMVQAPNDSHARREKIVCCQHLIPEPRTRTLVLGEMKAVVFFIMKIRWLA